MGTEWRFANVEHIFRKHAKSNGATYDESRPFATLDKGAIKRASELLGAKTWADLANAAHVSSRTAEKWGNSARRATVEQTIFPSLCDVAARPYKASPDAYQNSSAWLPQYIEESVAYALTNDSESQEDAAAALDDAWQRYNVATLLFAAFTLTGEELATVANNARYSLNMPTYGAQLRTSRPHQSGNPDESEAEAARIISDAEALEREAISRAPEWSRCSIDFANIKSLVDERANR